MFCSKCGKESFIPVSYIRNFNASKHLNTEYKLNRHNPKYHEIGSECNKKSVSSEEQKIKYCEVI